MAPPLNIIPRPEAAYIHSKIKKGYWVEGVGANEVYVTLTSAWKPLRTFLRSLMSMSITSITGGLRPNWASNTMGFLVSTFT